MKCYAAILGTLALTTLLAPASASAASITGTLTFTGSVQVTTTTINWLPNTVAGEGAFVTTAPGTEYFATVYNPAAPPNSSHGDTLDLDLTTTVLPLANFLHSFEEDPEVVSEYDDLSFTLTSLVAPTAVPCAGTENATNFLDMSCSLGVFTLTQQATSVKIALAVDGFFIDLTFGDDGTLNTAIGTYTTTITRDDLNTIEEIDAFLLAGNTIEQGYQAEYIATAIPEPASLVLFGLGSAALAANRRRKAKQNLNHPTVV